MSKVAGFIIGAALIVVGLATGNPALIIQGGLMIVSNAVLLLTMPKTPARQASEMSIQLGEQPRAAQFGETFTAGSLVDGFNYGGKYGTDWECLVIRLADHKCDGLVGFYVNDEYVLYTGNGNYPQFDSHHFELYFRGDTTNEPLPDVVLDHAPGWTAADVGESGCDVVVCYLFDPPDAKHPAWPGGRPRFGFVIRGKQCYDPRLDDTVTGGAGDHRWDDPATWEWSENPIVCRYNWVRGIYANDDVSDPSALLVGRGLTAEEAPPENIIAAANLCDGASPDALRYSQPLDSGDVGYTGDVEISLNATWFIRYAHNSVNKIERWHLPSLTLVGTVSTALVIGSPINADVAADGTVYWVTEWDDGGAGRSALWQSKAPRGAVTKTNLSPTSAWFSGPTRVFDLPDGTQKIISGVDYNYTTNGYIDGTARVAVVGHFLRDSARKSDNTIWGIFHPSGSSTHFSIRQITGGATVFDVTGVASARANPATGSTAVTLCHVPALSAWAAVTDGKRYLLDDTTGAIINSGSFTKPILNMPRKLPGPSSYYAGYELISLEDGSVLDSVNSLDWVNEDSGPSPNLFDPIHRAFIVHPNGGDHITVRFLNGFRYRIAGPVYANQDFIDVEGMFAAAVAGNVITHEGSVELEPAQAKSTVFSFTDDDLLSGSKVAWNQGFLSEANQEWVNTVVARYVEPAQQWNDHAAPVVRDTADITADGRPREQSVALRLVRDQGQALRVAEITRRLGRLWGRASVTLGPRFCEIEEGDWGTWQSDRYFGGATRTFRVEAYSINEKWQPTLTLREISADVYDDDGVFDPDNSSSTPNFPPDDIGTPDDANWTVTAGTLDSAGASVPVIIVTGDASDDDSAEAIIVEFWKDDGVLDPVADPDGIPWVMAGRYPPSTTRIEITNINPGETYYVAISYIVSGIAGDRLVQGPVTVSDIVVSVQVPTPLLFGGTGSNGTPANTTETDLKTYSLPAGTLAVNGQSLRIVASGTFAATTRARSVRLYFGATVIGFWNSVALSSVTQWHMDLVVTRTGATSQLASGFIMNNQQNEAMGRASPAATLSGAVTIKVTGQSAGAAVANDVICDFLLVEAIKNAS